MSKKDNNVELVQMDNDKVSDFINQEFGEVRGFTINGEPWFVGTDITNALGYSNSADAINVHVRKKNRKALKYKAYRDSLKAKIWNKPNDFSDKIIINEAGLYSLIFGSKMDKAQEFTDWVTDEILPSLRKTGHYEMSGTSLAQTIMDNPLEIAQVLIDYANVKKENEIMKPKAEFADAIQSAETNIDVGTLAKLLHKNGIDIGRNTLYNDLAHRGYFLVDHYNGYVAKQQYIEQGLFEMTEVPYMKYGKQYIRVKSLVTPKGQKYFINKYLKEWGDDDDVKELSTSEYMYDASMEELGLLD